MSLESYKKAIEAQKEREREYYPETNPSKSNVRQTRGTENVYVESNPRKRRTGCFVCFILIVALLIVAAIKNPSESEGEEMVKTYIVEGVNDFFRNEMTNDDNDDSKQFVAFLGLSLSSHLIDYVVDTKVDDYVLFSTFDCTIEEDDSIKTLVSGIILCGKIIPLKSDLNTEKLEMD